MAIRIAGGALVPYLPCPAPPPPLYAQHLVSLVYNCTISCCTVAVNSSMTKAAVVLPLQIFEKGLEPPFCNGVWHSLVDWHEGVSVTKPQGLLGCPPPSPPTPPP